MLSDKAALLWLFLFSALFVAAGLWASRRDRGSLEDYIVARNSQGALATLLTLMASSLGAWILFAPAQAATWGGLAAVLGYALGAMSPRLAMIPLGRRMRELMPQGHTLTEFLIARYGRGLYGLVLLIMLFYLFIALSAEITAMGQLVALLAPVPLWVTAAVVMGSTLIYTSYGGLRASIFTDKLQMAIIVPLLLGLLALGWHAAGGTRPTVQALQERAPQLLDLGDWSGIKAGLTFFFAILLTGVFHQGNWQRVYAARSTADMRRGFLLGGLMVVPFIFALGLFGLAFVALQPPGSSSVAVFALLKQHMPLWVAIALVPLGLALVMSSADTAISAVSSIIAVDLRRVLPRADSRQLMRLSRWLVYLLAVPVMIVAAQGYSVLYLFLLADLLCSAAAFPVFYGLFSRRHDGLTAMAGTLAGLVAGLALFPAPGQPMDTLLESFLVAALTPVAVTVLMRWLRPARAFDFAALAASVRRLDGDRA
ncbi:sodium:solute symporter family protein [Orrella sp. JC864]|uniref:sodium:solute symporter family protein n=1 Tax=Orrella sp. JC864 TaxID=3120298 RepID=UPI00300B65AA